MAKMIEDREELVTKQENVFLKRWPTDYILYEKYMKIMQKKNL